MIFLVLSHLADMSYPQGIRGVFHQGDMTLSMKHSDLDTPSIRVMFIIYPRLLLLLIPPCIQVLYPETEALQNPKCNRAMENEIAALKKNNT